MHAMKLVALIGHKSEVCPTLQAAANYSGEALRPRLRSR